jgi:hypothetical protein
MKKIVFLPLVILLASAVFLACGGDDDDGGQTIMGGVSLPVDTEINGLVSITSTNVRPGSTPVTSYPVNFTLGAYAFDDPVNSNPVAETDIRQDSTYSLTVNTLPGTVLYLYLSEPRTGATTRLDPVVVAGGNLRNDINHTRKMVTVKGSTSGYKEDGAGVPVSTVRIMDSANRILGSWSGGIIPATDYTMDVAVPPETAVYKLFVFPSMSSFSIDVEGDVEIRKDVGGDITKDIIYDRKTTKISGTITYKENDTAAGALATITVSTSPSSDSDDFDDTIIGTGSSVITNGSGSYEVKITQGPAATVHLHAKYTDMSSTSGFTYLGETAVPANAGTVNKNFTVNRNTTLISGAIAYKEDGTEAAISGLSVTEPPLSVVDGAGKTLGSGQVTGSVGSYQYTATITRPEAATTVYIVYNGVKSTGIAIGTGDKTKPNQSLILTRSTETIRGKIGGTGKNAVDTGNGVTVAKSPYPVSSADSAAVSAWEATRIGEAAINTTPAVSGEPYLYDGRITKLESNTHVYYYVQDSLGAYYKIGEADLEAGKAPYTKDFIIGLVNKKIVPGF